VHGSPKKRAATLCGWLRKDSAKNTVEVRDEKFAGAKEIITKYKVEKTLADRSLVEVELVTGRTHQIRAHMSHIGHPLIGDGKYGINRGEKKEGYKFQALYAYKLKFLASEEENILSYLTGREFMLDRDKIWFIKDTEAKG
jgi:23S rRNA pseudouridine955/2504/2580 synthase